MNVSDNIYHDGNIGGRWLVGIECSSGSHETVSAGEVRCMYELGHQVALLVTTLSGFLDRQAEEMEFIRTGKTCACRGSSESKTELMLM